ncbi:DUF305 domain-containing protein [Streptomyces sp. TRM68367]|uniref:DUF305 domain-containing protein n=1 Tax=Streptomyces sp. TRM68367 TaxID=2758415 RepID=UPI00165B1470|nr:DUF305 domain-containing protein [Streptomyces sp. TRM68367]MBC9723880.1 DUF305 domain-containing protein [Streptomyces sp. TRM68367]
MNRTARRQLPTGCEEIGFQHRATDRSIGVCMNRRIISASRVGAAALMTVGLALAAAPAAVADDDSEFNEKEFLAMTVDHHFGGVRMAELCVQKATRAHLKGLCSEIKDTQSEEIATMRSWLKNWYGTDETPSVPPETKPMLDRLSGLSGRTFDVELSRDFAQHHREFLPDADKCRKHAEHGELRAMCDTMYQTQTEEIGKFEAVIAGKPITVDTGNGGLATVGSDSAGTGGAGWLAVGGVAAALGTAAVSRRLRRQ